MQRKFVLYSVIFISLLQPYQACTVDWDQITKWSGYSVAGLLGIGWYVHARQMRSAVQHVKNLEEEIKRTQADAQESKDFYKEIKKNFKIIQQQLKDNGFVIDYGSGDIVIKRNGHNCKELAETSKNIVKQSDEVEQKYKQESMIIPAVVVEKTCDQCPILQSRLNEQKQRYTELYRACQIYILPEYKKLQMQYGDALNYSKTIDQFLLKNNIKIIFDKDSQPSHIQRKCGLIKILPVAIPAFKLRDGDRNDERHQKILSLGYSYNEKEKLYVHADKKQSLSIDDHIKLTSIAQKNLISAIALTSDALILSQENNYHMTKLVRQSVLLAVYFGNKKLPFNAITVHNEIQQKKK